MNKRTPNICLMKICSKWNEHLKGNRHDVQFEIDNCDYCPDSRTYGRKEKK